MEPYNLTLRFDDPDHALTAEDGLPIDEVAKLLHSLSEAIDVDNEHKVVLSQVKGNCYALNLSTYSVTKYETMKVIHRKVSENDYNGLTIKERQYAIVIKDVLNGHYTLDVYDDKKDFRVRVEKVQIPRVPTYYYEIGTLYGIVTSIGGQTIDGASSILISQQNYPIKVTQSQEQELLEYFKKIKLLFTLRKKLRYDNDTVVSAELESFEPTNKETFAMSVRKLRAKHKDGLLKDYSDPVEALRELRDEA